MHVFLFQWQEATSQLHSITEKIQTCMMMFSYAQGCCRKMPTCNPYWQVFNLTCQVRNAISSALCAILFIVWSRSLCAFVKFTAFCWWKKSRTSWYGESTIIYRVLYIQTVVVWDFWTINSNSHISIIPTKLWSQALHLLHDGQSKRLPPNVIANNAAVSACEKAPILRKAFWLFRVSMIPLLAGQIITTNQPREFHQMVVYPLERP